MHEDCYHKMYLNEEHHWWFKSKVDIVRTLFGLYVGDLSGTKMLDAGCGTSFLSKSIFPDFQNLYNVDSCDLSLDYSRKRGLTNVIKADLTNLAFPDEMFDACVCMDVIEHNEDDKKLVNELSRVMKKGGTVIAAVPAMQSLWGPQDEKLGHFRRYNHQSFGKLFEEKFDILKLSYFNSLLFPMIFLMRKLFNLFPHILKQKDEVDINSKFINRCLYKIFSLESILLQHINFPAGVSLIVVARKK